MSVRGSDVQHPEAVSRSKRPPLSLTDAREPAPSSYLQKNDKPVVIVVDGVDAISDSPRCLQRLQEKAKLWADTNIAKVRGLLPQVRREPCTSFCTNKSS